MDTANNYILYANSVRNMTKLYLISLLIGKAAFINCYLRFLILIVICNSEPGSITFPFLNAKLCGIKNPLSIVIFSQIFTRNFIFYYILILGLTAYYSSFSYSCIVSVFCRLPIKLFLSYLILMSLFL